MEKSGTATYMCLYDRDGKEVTIRSDAKGWTT